MSCQAIVYSRWASALQLTVAYRAPALGCIHCSRGFYSSWATCVLCSAAGTGATVAPVMLQHVSDSEAASREQAAELQASCGSALQLPAGQQVLPFLSSIQYATALTCPTCQAGDQIR